jgi:acetylornithine deacetylase
VRERSITGQERGAAARVVELAHALGLHATLDEHDLGALRAHPGHPGEEAARTELVGATVTLPGREPRAPRLCVNGHIDVVTAGTEAWTDWTDWTRDP